MAKKKKLNTKPEAAPLLRAGLAEKVDRIATEKVPQELQSIDFAISPNPFEFKRVDPQELDQYRDDPVTPLRPNWVDQCYRPRRAVDYGRPKRQLEHRGRKVDPVVILGPDDRRTYFDTSYPWGCVCKIITTAGTGSGVIVGPRHVLTASHVVNWAVNGGVTGSVEVHRAGAAVSAISIITRVHAFTRITGPNIAWSELDEDYAVVITADRIGDRFGWLGARTYNSSWDDEPYWMNIGYPGDIALANQPIFQRGKELDEHAFDFGSGRAMDTDADIFPGQSGSPMFAFWEEGPYVVSVVSAEDRSDRENYCSGGRDLPRLVRLARDQNP